MLGIKKKHHQRKFVILVTIVMISIASLSWTRWRPAQRFDFNVTSENEIRVMTWNVGYFSTAHDKNLRDVDLNSISDLIRKTNADVVILQELGAQKQADVIAASLGENWQAASVLTGHGNQTLSIISQLTHHQPDNVEYHKCGGRNVLAASFLFQDTRSIYIVGVHSPHPARGMQATLDNIQCAIALAKDRKEQVKIVAGDMNYNFDVKNNENELYQHILQDYGDGTRLLGETYYAHTRIDHVFHSPKNLFVNTENSGLLDLPVRFAKVPGFRDHRPIIVTYDLGKQ